MVVARVFFWRARRRPQPPSGVSANDCSNSAISIVARCTAWAAACAAWRPAVDLNAVTSPSRRSMSASTRSPKLASSEPDT